ncbi:MAG: hypothetical protein ACRDQX_01340 [Pseudonocardiaceae bacterium]
MALLRQRLHVAGEAIRLDEVGGGGTEIERLELMKARQPLGRGRTLLIISNQAQQVISDAQPVQIGTTPQLAVHIIRDVLHLQGCHMDCFSMLMATFSPGAD